MGAGEALGESDASDCGDGNESDEGSTKVLSAGIIETLSTMLVGVLGGTIKTTTVYVEEGSKERRKDFVGEMRAAGGGTRSKSNVEVCG